MITIEQIKEAWDALEKTQLRYGLLCDDPACGHGCRTKIQHLKFLSEQYNDLVDRYLKGEE